jgi:DNA-binding transcriptional regulator YdaS (Cro superfamily)
MSVAMDIATYRKTHELSQSAFAALLTDAGYPATQSLVSQWETGEVALTAERAIQIEKVTGGACPRGVLRPDLWGGLAAA